MSFGERYLMATKVAQLEAIEEHMSFTWHEFCACGGSHTMCPGPFVEVAISRIDQYLACSGGPFF